jgi:hypothetical protein
MDVVATISIISDIIFLLASSSSAVAVVGLVRLGRLARVVARASRWAQAALTGCPPRSPSAAAAAVAAVRARRRFARSIRLCSLWRAKKRHHNQSESSLAWLDKDHTETVELMAMGPPGQGQRTGVDVMPSIVGAKANDFVFKSVFFMMLLTFVGVTLVGMPRAPPRAAAPLTAIAA